MANCCNGFKNSIAFSNGSSGRSNFSGINSSNCGASGSLSCVFCCFDLLCCSFLTAACAACALSNSAFFLALRCLLRNFLSSDGGRFSVKFMQYFKILNNFIKKEVKIYPYQFLLPFAHFLMVYHII